VIRLGQLLDWVDEAAKIGQRCGMRFQNTFTRDEEDTLRQWIGTHTWGQTLLAIYQLSHGGGKTSSDPCRLYFEKRDYFYDQYVASL
jgi:hypothetical protein